MYFAKVNQMISKSVVLACAASLLLLVGCSRVYQPAEVEYDHSVSPYHHVGNGESIASIAQKYDMDTMELVRLNGLKPPYHIFVGQKLLVKTAAISAKHGKAHFDLPATNGGAEMRGDVEVSTLEPLENTISVDQYSLATEPGGVEQKDGRGIEADTAEVPSRANKANSSVPIAAGAYVWPVKGRVIKDFKAGKNGNDGINISAPKGTPVQAANNGVVVHAGNQVAGLGNVVLVKHAGGYMTVYTHLDTVKVKKGQRVSAGYKIGTVGKTGNVRQPQLHFEIRNGKTPVDPNEYLN